jgi:TrkA domain protein
VNVTETLLPAVGIRYEFTTAAGTHMGVLSHRDGRADLLVFDAGDPDRPRFTVRLTESEAGGLADLLGAPRIAERFADLTREVPGLETAQLDLPEASPFAGRTLADTRARTRTGASVVALVRGEDVIASPLPSEKLYAGDVLVVIGTADGLDRVKRLLEG